MDFAFSSDQKEIVALAKWILDDQVTKSSLEQAEAGVDRFDATLWAALGDAGLLGIGLPESVGGLGYGIIEQCLVLAEIGRHVAPVPYLACVVLGAAPIAEFGTTEQAQTWARPAAEGKVWLSAALAESATWGTDRPRVTATRVPGGFRLDGVKTAVPSGMPADLILVPASIDGSVAVFLVETKGEGVTRHRQGTTNRDSSAYLALDGVVVRADAVLGSLVEGPRVLRWMVERATVGLCALQLGVVEEALAQTAIYTATRQQFDRPIATFQAVSHRCADCYIDVEAVRLTLWQAAWRLAEGLDAGIEVQVAKFWASEAGHRVAHAVVHLHGGMGVATDHTIHRYFVAAKRHEFMLGGATEQLRRIGAALAAGVDVDERERPTRADRARLS